jgi:hypothetical protein
MWWPYLETFVLCSPSTVELNLGDRGTRKMPEAVRVCIHCPAFAYIHIALPLVVLCHSVCACDIHSFTSCPVRGSRNSAHECITVLHTSPPNSSKMSE